MRRLAALLLVPLAVLPVAPAPAPARPASSVAAKVVAKVVANDLAFPAAFTLGPDGAIWYGERFTGRIRVIGPKRGSNRVFFRIPDVVGAGEQGLLGLALHPEFPGAPLVYAYVTRTVHGHERDQIVRIRDQGGHGMDMHVIWSSPTTAGVYHDGGRIEFGPDGMLYAVQGEAHDASNSQDLSNDAGKILRMTPGGKPAPGNPFADSRILAYGIRNSFGFDFDPRTGRLWETENGPSCNDELNRIVAGRNYGWGSHQTCSTPPDPPRNTNQDGPTPVLPKRWYTPVIAPTGAVFCQRCGLGPASLGRLFFGAYDTGQVRRVTLTEDRLGVIRQTVVYVHGEGVLSMEAGPDGRLYFSDSHAIYRLVLSS
ncbi:MAG: PQQ-dependent sugar dehydrogenase [Actinomycetota bacterium]|nr:PQQ-dependent sugar dehydrogenase [Actinomycetota bacterium]